LSWIWLAVRKKRKVMTTSKNFNSLSLWALTRWVALSTESYLCFGRGSNVEYDYDASQESRLWKKDSKSLDMYHMCHERVAELLAKLQRFGGELGQAWKEQDMEKGNMDQVHNQRKTWKYCFDPIAVAKMTSLRPVLSTFNEYVFGSHVLTCKDMATRESITQVRLARHWRRIRDIHEREGSPP